ncbi:hypothetical protein QPK24_03005 [Paenibacillus polygoni]|uniref:Mobilization protein n=1 Tax=Paenibacillus polygoni TaxID=3050112 RepID=A0ABY8X2R9_9BACL|nr:hypothetical protein [Paenibacillus polygoni]WIV19730.1 hypothetical protein QPK24_03005 [Paenibacillus polygoni]
MSEKSLDKKGRWRSVTVGFRVSPEENKQIDTMVGLCGMTKQDYITSRLLERDIIVNGNPRVFKALRNTLYDVLEELKRIKAGDEVEDELLDTIRMISWIMEGLSHEAR